jgi:hypothetical protein
MLMLSVDGAVTQPVEINADHVNNAGDAFERGTDDVM